MTLPERSNSPVVELMRRKLEDEFRAHQRDYDQRLADTKELRRRGGPWTRKELHWLDRRIALLERFCDEQRQFIEAYNRGDRDPPTFSD